MKTRRTGHAEIRGKWGEEGGKERWSSGREEERQRGKGSSRKNKFKRTAGNNMGALPES